MSSLQNQRTRINIELLFDEKNQYAPIKFRRRANINSNVNVHWHLGRRRMGTSIHPCISIREISFPIASLVSSHRMTTGFDLIRNETRRKGNGLRSWSRGIHHRYAEIAEGQFTGCCERTTARLSRQFESISLHFDLLLLLLVPQELHQKVHPLNENAANDYDYKLKLKINFIANFRTFHDPKNGEEFRLDQWKEGSTRFRCFSADFLFVQNGRCCRKNYG